MKKLARRQHLKKPIGAMDSLEREGQAMVDSANPAPNLTQRRKMLPTWIAMEEAAKEKTNGGGRRPRLGHQVNS
jgi:hypothetical protein